MAIGNIDTPLYARLPGDQKAECLDGQPAWGEKRFVEEADVDSRTCKEDVVSTAPGERKGEDSQSAPAPPVAAGWL